jgi:hypothetical protein
VGGVGLCRSRSSEAKRDEGEHKTRAENAENRHEASSHHFLLLLSSSVRAVQ